MPILPTPHFRRPKLLFNGHLESIYPALFRKVQGVEYERERLELADGDFLDLDWLDRGSRHLVLLTHGLEGSSDRQYIKGMAKQFSERNWDVLAWNCRSCSGEMNRHFRMYHHGEIGDLGAVIQHALRTKAYESIALIGFSMGGNIHLKYLGVHGKAVPEQIRCCVAFSSPTDLRAGAEILDKRENIIYYRRFLRSLSLKVEAKNRQFPGRLEVTKLKEIKIWRDFDEYFSAPLSHHRDADDFYENASAKNFMAGITVPTLLVQALNDPILPEACYPKKLCEAHPMIALEMPKYGGHCGFMEAGKGVAWSEERALGFVKTIL